jgi:hypothetical protein
MSDVGRLMAHLKGFILNSLDVESMTEADVLFQRGIESSADIIGDAGERAE